MTLPRQLFTAVRLSPARSACLLGATVAGVCGFPGYARAQVQLPTVNLGLTSFEDGFGNQGWFLQEFPTYYDADELKDANGATVPGPNRLTTISTTTHIVYVSRQRLMKARLAFEALQPWADVDTRFGNGPPLRTRGFADLTLGTGLQWAPRKMGGGVFVHRFMLDISVPTGKYSDRQPINIGNNYVTINPYYAVTYELRKVEFSARFHYLWNTVNRRPFIGTGFRSEQPGQAFHMNYAMSYEIIPKVRIGFNGYWLKQLTDDKINGIRIPNSRESVVGLGGGLQVYTGKNVWIHLNGYKETGARNRAQGSSLMLRLSKAIPG